MKLLFDENIFCRIVKKLIHTYSDCELSVRLKLIGQPDTSVWQEAKQLGYDIITFNEDYVFLSESRGFPPKVVFIRLVGIPTHPLAELLIREFETIHSFLTSDTDERGCLELIDVTRL